MNTQTQYLIPSKHPKEVLESLPRLANQDAKMRQYKSGYESYFGMLPVLFPDDPQLELKVSVSGSVVKALAEDLLKTAPWVMDHLGPNEFRRTIVAVEDPKMEDRFDDDWERSVIAVWSLPRSPKILKEGAELLVAQWGPGFTSPVHGHAAGLLHEDILYGRIRVNSYQWVRDEVVRPVRTDIAGRGTLISSYAQPDPKGRRMGLIHNFTAVDPSASVHYVAEHTRDGRDNGFEVEYFPNPLPGDVDPITPDQGRLLRIGEVVLVRSSNVSEYGDHYIVITGPPVLKEHGLRPQDVAIHVPTVPMLDMMTPIMGAALLKLNDKPRREFLKFHNIQVDGSTVTFPEVK